MKMTIKRAATKGREIFRIGMKKCKNITFKRPKNVLFSHLVRGKLTGDPIHLSSHSKNRLN